MDHQRDRINNPNFPSPSHRSPSYTPYQPAAALQPPQQPPFDPFARPDHRRDPFMPPTFGARRDSLNGSNGRPSAEYPSKDVAQSNPQPPPSPFRSGTSNTYSHDRRDSLGDAGPSHSLQNHSSILHRHMPPPAASPKHSPSQSFSSNAVKAPIPSPLSRPRESSAPVSNQRSMSIQSMMGSDNGPSANIPSWSNGPGRGASGSYTQPPSPHDRRFGLKGDSEGEPLPHSPIRRPDGVGYPPYGDRPDTSLASPSAATSNLYQSPERGGRGFSSLLQPFQSSSNESNGVPARPYSQPAGADGGAAPPGPVHYENRHGSRSRDDYGGGTFEKAVRDRSFSDLDAKKRSSMIEQYDRPAHDAFATMSGPSQPMHVPYQPRGQEYRESMLNGGGTRRDAEFEMSVHRRPGSPMHGSSFPSSTQAASTNGTIDQASFDSAARYPYENPGLQSSPYPPNSGIDRIGYAPERYGDSQVSKTPPIDAQLRKSIEESHRQSLSRFANDFGRRPDRSSPLPQAVQGAQSQPAGSGRDPGIKSEFARMFSGLGSGVGSTPQPQLPASNGAPTPNQRTPEEDELEPFPPRTAPESTVPKSGPGSRGGRRGGKRALAETEKRDSDSGDGRATPVTGSTRGTKRNRYTQQTTSHHHHHHPQGPHHHHYHRKADENTTAPVNGRLSNTPYSSFRFPPPTPAPNPASVPHHHHHHHPVPLAVPHHHHHPAKPVADVRVKRPTTTISTSPLLRGVSHLPRKHLGSQLYSPSVNMPATSITTVDSPATHQITTNPNPLPHFDISKVNSTFSIRIPRNYLADKEREKICKARRVWGTDVYTDDSDPLAAAFHAGWIRGAWGDEVDVSIILGLPNASASSVAEAKMNGSTDDKESPELNKDGKTKDSSNGKIDNDPYGTLTAPPPGGPLPPPSNRDLHLTVLLLPPLEKYTGSVWHGIKSRSWGANHDGLSFKIDKVEWVDEGLGSRWEERGLAAKKRRLGNWDAGNSRQTSGNSAKRKALSASRVVGTVRAGRVAKVAA